MPFIITRDQPHGKLFATRFADGEIGWQPSKEKATRFDEAEADAEAGAINQYASTEAVVEGAR